MSELTPRQRDVVRQLRRGFSNREIAAELGLSLDTVKSYMKLALLHTGTRTRLQLALLAERSGV